MTKDITIADLQVMQGAVEYRRWLFRQIKDHMGSRILEVGAGIGNYTEFLLDREIVVCLELHPSAAALLRERFSGNPNIRVVEGDIADPSCTTLSAHGLDTAICLNVLEHVHDDRAAIENIRRILLPGGRLLLIVPAVPAVMGTVDRALGHYRRYTRGNLLRVVREGGMQVEKVYPMNLLGLLGWLWNNRIVRRSEEYPPQINFFSRFVVPWLSALESRIPPPVGLSLVCIARCP